MGGLTAALVSVALGIGAAGAQRARADPAAERDERFESLLRTYPQRPPRETIAQVERLVDEGDFPQRDRAEYWLGSALSSLHDREGARRWFARLQQEHAGSVWAERSWLSLGDAAAQERRYTVALDWYGKAMSANDEGVREIGRVAIRTTQVLRMRQLWAWAAGAVVVVTVALLGISLLRHRPVLLWPLPGEARVVLPVLFVLAVLSARQDPAPRAAVLELCVASAVLVVLSGLRLRAAAPRGGARALHAVGTVTALGALAYLAVYRGGLIGMLLETFRAGPE